MIVLATPLWWFTEVSRTTRIQDFWDKEVRCRDVQVS
jgi:hypothetical protein